MVNRSANLTVVLNGTPAGSTAETRLQLKPAWIIVRTCGLISIFVMAVTLSFVIFAKTSIVPIHVVELPQNYLPGGKLPSAVICMRVMNGMCIYLADFEGKTIHFGYDESSQKLTGAAFVAFEYTMGDLMIAWGTPTSINQRGNNIEVNWATRTAYLTTCNFQPTSHIGYIGYSLEPKVATPWHGFTTSKSGC